MYVIVWKYVVAGAREHDFRLAYGPDGDWAQLFAHYDGFIGTELVVTDEPGNFLTIDRWESEEAFVAFMSKGREDYDRLDEMLSGLTEAEQLIGKGTAA